MFFCIFTVPLLFKKELVTLLVGPYQYDKSESNSMYQSVYVYVTSLRQNCGTDLVIKKCLVCFVNYVVSLLPSDNCLQMYLRETVGNFINCAVYITYVFLIICLLILGPIFVPARHGSSVLLYENFTYSRVAKGLYYCSKKSKLKCQAKVKLNENHQLISAKGMHNHEPPPILVPNQHIRSDYWIEKL